VVRGQPSTSWTYVFYLPCGIFPVRTERQTGSVSQLQVYRQDRFQYQPFFWAISKQRCDDRADIEECGRGFSVNTAMSLAATQGQISLSYFNEWQHNTDGIDPTWPSRHSVTAAGVIASHRQARPRS
jgi:hypothetical protein